MKATTSSRPYPNLARNFQRLWNAVALTLAVAAFVASGSVACGGSAGGSIGAVLGKRHSDGRVYVRDVPAGMTGAEAGLEPGDEIVAIDGRDVRTMSTEDVQGALRGKIGTTVVLTVDRAGARRDVPVRRGPFRQ
jgi:C-terminal processing protease CtpA/Prc